MGVGHTTAGRKRRDVDVHVVQAARFDARQAGQAEVMQVADVQAPRHRSAHAKAGPLGQQVQLRLRLRRAVRLRAQTRVTSNREAAACKARGREVACCA